MPLAIPSVPPLQQTPQRRTGDGGGTSGAVLKLAKAMRHRQLNKRMKELNAVPPEKRDTSWETSVSDTQRKLDRLAGISPEDREMAELDEEKKRVDIASAKALVTQRKETAAAQKKLAEARAALAAIRQQKLEDAQNPDQDPDLSSGQHQTPGQAGSLTDGMSQRDLKLFIENKPKMKNVQAQAAMGENSSWDMYRQTAPFIYVAGEDFKRFAEKAMSSETGSAPDNPARDDIAFSIMEVQKNLMQISINLKDMTPEARHPALENLFVRAAEASQMSPVPKDAMQHVYNAWTDAETGEAGDGIITDEELTQFQINMKMLSDMAMGILPSESMKKAVKDGSPDNPVDAAFAEAEKRLADEKGGGTADEDPDKKAASQKRDLMNLVGAAE